MPDYDRNALRMLRERIERRKARVVALQRRYDAMGPNSDRGHLSWEAVSEQALMREDERLLAKFEEGFG